MVEGSSYAKQKYFADNSSACAGAGDDQVGMPNKVIYESMCFYW